MTRMHTTRRTAHESEAAWQALRVLERLEVGPVRLDRRTVAAPYRIVQAGKSSTIDLVYRYHEDVFDPEDAATVNLASMIAAQVALNYGLFCDEIVFHGPLDALDQRFLETMLENTAREITVKKLLEPNPFLVGVARDLPVPERTRHTQARLTFDAPASATPASPWAAEPQRIAVLSSGGKDSLLSHGLLREMGCEVHPVFVNESGRHWLTALNAFCHLSATHPQTTRVWTNSDRVFTWFLRHLPFVRADFQNVRSDEYPIRLWTVAVFLFGVLPLLRKRHVGRLVIGDEFDTSRRVTHKGIPHYDGLYDQSRWFDRALTRYFQRKKWFVHQFSMLRPMSELLIQKTLAARYPDLLAHQVSCHAAHVDGERVRPCGRCEKCRRIVGMLLALGADPTDCGYDAEQVQRCLERLPKDGIHQEFEGVEHLAHLLCARGVIAHDTAVFPARERAYITKLRFDRERAALTDVPRDLRRNLYKIVLEHADGCVRRVGRRWIDFDLWRDPGLDRPDPLEKPGGNRMPREKKSKAKSAPGAGAARTRARGNHASEKDAVKNDHILGELTWPEAKTRFREVDIALLPVGAIEQHGPHLPLDTDAFDAEYLAREVAAACGKPKPLVLPLIPYGVSYHHEDFAGTLSLSPDTLSRVVYEIGMSAARHGIAKLIMVNGHGGNGPSLHFAAQMINRDAHVFTCVDTGETSDHDIESMAETPNDVHAGEIETSTTLAVRPHLVRLTKARKLVPQFSSQYLDFTSRRSVTWYAHTKRLSRNGVLGDPTRASREKGEEMWRVMIRNLVELVEHLKTLSLDEIYQTRY